jgi:hypothetical protein
MNCRAADAPPGMFMQRKYCPSLLAEQKQESATRSTERRQKKTPPAQYRTLLRWRTTFQISMVGSAE